MAALPASEYLPPETVALTKVSFQKLVVVLEKNNELLKEEIRRIKSGQNICMDRLS
jgi:hypothetical protein